jgi:uncharacterized protein
MDVRPALIQGRSMTKKKELTASSLHIEIRKDDVQEDGTFSGYGSVFGVVDSYGTVIDKGAFSRTLKNRKSPVRLLWQHNSDQPIGVFTEMSEDNVGLKFTGQLNLEVQQGKEAYSLLKQGALDGMSIGFYIISEQLTDNVTHFTEVKLREISIVTFPANEDATISSVRSAFDDLTPGQRLQTLSFINSFRTSPQTDDPPAAVVAITEGEHSEVTEPDKEQHEDPLEDTELLHSLGQLQSDLRTAKTALALV